MQDEDADREAGERRHRADDREGDQRGVGLVGRLGQGERCQAADDQRVDRPGRDDCAEPVRGGVCECHRQHGDAGVCHSRRGGEQQRSGASSGGQQAGRGDRDGDQAGDERGHGGRVPRRLTARVHVRPEQGDDDADRRHDGEDRRPAAAGERLSGEHAAQRDADEQRTSEDHLHREQRPGPQRRSVQGEAAGLQCRTDQPQRLPGKERQQPRSTGRLGRRARGLPVFHGDPRSVEHGRQRGEQ